VLLLAKFSPKQVTLSLSESEKKIKKNCCCSQPKSSLSETDLAWARKSYVADGGDAG